MDSGKKENQPAKYMICIKNHLDSRWEHWFEGMTITHTEDDMTILTGEVIDQSALHGLFEKIRSLNLTLVSFQTEHPQISEEGTSEHEKS